MIEFTRTRHINATPERVWPFVADITAWPRWFTEAERGEVLSGEGVGRRQRMYGHARGLPTEIDSVVTTWEPPTRMRWHHEAERVDGKPGSVVFAKDATAEVTIEVSEPMGAETYLYLSSGAHSFVARVRSGARFDVAQKLKVAFDLTKAHLFDLATEQTIS